MVLGDWTFGVLLESLGLGVYLDNFAKLLGGDASLLE